MSLTARNSWGDRYVGLKDSAGPQRTASEDPPADWKPPAPVGFVQVAPMLAVTHDARCPNPCPDLDLTAEHATHCTEWPEPEHCSRCRRPKDREPLVWDGDGA
jgi:hypothetical protein